MSVWLRLLCRITELAIVVLAFVSWDDTATFAKMLAVLAVVALWDIRSSLQQRPGGSR